MTLVKAAPHTVKALEVDGVRRLLVLDFDGVVNSFRRNGTFPKDKFPGDKRENHPNPHYNPFAKVKRREDREPKAYSLQWSSEFVDELNRFTSDDSVQLVWLTTWREHMNDVVSRLSITSARDQLFLPWDDDESHDLPQFGKYKVLVDFLEDRSSSLKTAWVDDVLFNRNTLADYEALPKNFLPKDLVATLTDGKLTHVDTLAFAPDGRFGVDRYEWSRVLNFLS